MGLELVIFIAAILLGIFIYWRESNSNKAYRTLNKIVNSKALQMSKDNPKGFVYKQSFIPRLIFIVTMCLIVALVLEFVTPISVFGSYNGVSAFSSIVVGTIVGTYLANFVLKSSKVIEEHGDTIGNVMDEAIDKGKDYIENLRPETPKEEVIDKQEARAKDDGKSARERLKDKGLL
ncbi:hypothetical protein [Winogradskyella aurantiaca]|uniref:hypothetical protein n=1 Tax=Winogradskyella aurantiaca TaxID=2219558 RepID=UPI000E1C99B0|nr:hypothetical protein [Winogradskyella aurantiaca]